MIKKNLKTLIITSIVILLPILAGVFLWDKLPEQIPTHWNANGEVDDWSSKAFAVFGLPCIMLVFQWLCVLGTSADPKKANHSEKIIQLVLWIIPVISVAVHAMVYMTALGAEVRVEVIMPILIGLVLTIIGNYLPKCKQSYTIGIKIPWTLNSEENWNYTHRLAGKLWVIGGFLIIFTGFLKQYWIFAAITAIMVIVPIICSYRFYVKHDKNKQNN